MLTIFREHLFIHPFCVVKKCTFVEQMFLTTRISGVLWMFCYLSIPQHPISSPNPDSVASPEEYPVGESGRVEGESYRKGRPVIYREAARLRMLFYFGLKLIRGKQGAES